MALRIHRITRHASVWVSWAMWIATARLRIRAGTSARAYISTMWAARCMRSVSATRRFSYNRATAITIMAFIRARCVRFRPAVRWRSSTIKNSLNCCLSLWTMASKLCMSSRRCARFEWALWRAGEQSIIGRMSHRRLAGLRFICMDRCSGSTRFSFRWEVRTMPSARCRKRRAARNTQQKSTATEGSYEEAEKTWKKEKCKI